VSGPSSASKVPASADLANAHLKIIDSGDSIVLLLKTFTPILELCTVDPVEKNADISSSPRIGYTPTAPSLPTVFMATLSSEITRFTAWLTNLTTVALTNPIPAPGSTGLTSCHLIHSAALCALTRVAKRWESTVHIMYSDPGLARPLTGYGDRQLFSVFTLLKATSNSIRTGLETSLQTQLGVCVLPSMTAFEWSDPHTPFMGSMRTSYAATAWVVFLVNAYLDLIVIPSVANGDLMPREVFYKTLGSAIDGLCIRYREHTISRVMSPQWLVDVVSFLKFTNYFVRVANYFDESDGPMSQGEVDSRSIMGKSVSGVVAEVVDMVTVLALTIGGADSVESFMKVMRDGEGERGAKSADAKDRLEAVEKMLSAPEVDKQFDFSRFMFHGKLDVLLVNACMSGLLEVDGVKLFDAVKGGKFEFDWDFLVANTRLSEEDVRSVVGKRHELGKWEYPELSKEEADTRRALTEALAKTS
jgi:hypothetical protein